MKKLFVALLMLGASQVYAQIKYVKDLGSWPTSQEGTSPLVCSASNNLAQYYNTTTSKNRCCQNGSWNDCISTAGISGSGTAGKLSKWTGTTALGDSLVSESGTVVTVDGTELQPLTDDTISLGDNTHRYSDLWLGPASIHMGTATGDELLMSYDTGTNRVNTDVAGTATMSMGAGTIAGPSGGTLPFKPLSDVPQIKLVQSNATDGWTMHASTDGRMYILRTGADGYELYTNDWILVEGTGGPGGGDPAMRIGVHDSNNSGGIQAWYMSQNQDGQYAIHQSAVGDRFKLDGSGNTKINGTLMARNLADNAYTQLVLDGITGTGTTNGVSLALSGTKTLTLDNQAWFPNTSSALVAAVSTQAVIGYDQYDWCSAYYTNPHQSACQQEWVWERDDVFLDGPPNYAPVVVRRNGQVPDQATGLTPVAKCNGPAGSCSSVTSPYNIPGLTGRYDSLPQQANTNCITGATCDRLNSRPVFLTHYNTDINLLSCTGATSDFCSSTNVTFLVTPTSMPTQVALAVDDTDELYFAWTTQNLNEVYYAHCTLTNRATGPLGCGTVSTPALLDTITSGSNWNLINSLYLEVTDTGVIKIPTLFYGVVSNGTGNGSWNRIRRLCTNSGGTCTGQDISGAASTFIDNLWIPYAGGDPMLSSKPIMVAGIPHWTSWAGNPYYTSWVQRCTSTDCGAVSTTQTISGGKSHAAVFPLYTLGLYGVWYGQFSPNSSGVRLCSDQDCVTYTAVNTSATYIPVDKHYANHAPWPGKAKPAIEHPSGDVYAVIDVNGYNLSIQPQWMFIGTSSLAADGTSIGKAANYLGDGYFRGVVKAGSVTIEGTGAGMGMLKLGNVAADPATGIAGQMYFRTSDSTFRCFDGTSWGPCGSASSGTLGQVAVFSGPTTTAGDPGLTYDSVTNTLTVTHDAAGGGVTLANSDNVAATLKFNEPSGSGSNYVSLAAPALASNTTYTLPNSYGSAGQYLTTDGLGGMTWSNPPTGYGQLSYQSGAPPETPTSITVTSAGTYYPFAASALTGSNFDPFGNVTSTGTDLTNNRFKIGTDGAGDYIIVAHITYSAPANSETHWLANVNGTTDVTVTKGGEEYEGVTNYATTTVSGIVTLAANDTVELRVTSDSSSDVINVYHLNFAIFKPGGGSGGGGGGTLTVGTSPIVSGTAGRLLFEGTGNVLQEDADLNWSSANNMLGLGVTATDTLSIKSATHTGFTGSEYNTGTAGVQTTDATQTALKTYAVADNTSCTIEAMVSARTDATGANRASYIVRASVYREGGSATLNGTADTFEKESDVNWDATATVSGNNVSISVTGAAATNINWVGNIRYQCVSDNL